MRFKVLGHNEIIKEVEALHIHIEINYENATPTNCKRCSVSCIKHITKSTKVYSYKLQSLDIILFADKYFRLELILENLSHFCSDTYKMQTFFLHFKTKYLLNHPCLFSLLLLHGLHTSLPQYVRVCAHAQVCVCV